MLAVRTLGVARLSVRSASQAFQTIPTNAGKVPPKLEDFDPLNPGEWQLGAGGKILPRLPEGTRCGKLVMGKYGLYDPVLKKRVDTYSKALLEGKKSEDAGPFDRGLTSVVKVLSTCCLVLGLYNLATLFIGHPLPPFSHLKAPGS
ncbi:unnamed protein product, partial [Mesorhabditis belari]|uniref:Uncharacterized protein n=1 Tax=Mesorhabditis belari TaxID=2138241 RepID=A0AAF3EX37_9BILA